MSRWAIAFVGTWGICLFGMYIAWLIRLTMNCLFSQGCFHELSIQILISSVNIKDVMTRGTLLAIAFIFITWVSRTRQ